MKGKLTLPTIIDKRETCCWSAGVCFAHAHLTRGLPTWFALSSLAAFCLPFAPSHPPLGSLEFLCSGKFSLGFYSPLRDQCDRCQGEVTRERLQWLPSFICTLPTFTRLMPALLTIGTYPPYEHWLLTS